MIHVAWAADAGYFRHGATMFTSLLASNKDVHAWVLCGADVPEADRQHLVRWAEARGAKVDCIVPEVSLPAQLPGISRLTRAAWLRLFLPELLPQLDRVIYLDVDMIVRDSLAELWTLDLGDRWLAAVTDIPRKVGGILPYQRVGLADASQYFNSGLLLIDLERFRRERVAHRVLRFAAEHPDKVALADQDPLNAELHAHRYALPLRWNVMAPVHEGGIDHGFPFTEAEAQDALRRPAVIHYSGLWKPWHYRSKHPLRGLYAKYRKQGPWPDWEVEGQTLKHRILRLFPESTAWWMTYYYNTALRSLGFGK